MLRYNVLSSSGTFDSVASGSDVDGTAVFIGSEWQKVARLTANVTVDAETESLTVTPVWQVSNDKSTYYNAAPSNNAANVVMATGTSGADASVTRSIAAPDAVYGWRYARMSLLVGGTTGTSSDSYSIAYSYRALTGSQAGG